MNSNLETTAAGKRPIHLICNAHLDPVWKWEWEEGLGEALSTFETAADLIDENPDFIFNHNESVLYEWTLQYRPDLFKRIQEHVKNGRWQIAGGWYLQPDCNMPDGESFIRQILVGREFFRKHFAVEPRLAYNFDTFGHHGNLPQMLVKSGYEAYVHFRPAAVDLSLPSDIYKWRGINGSEITSYRPPWIWYGTNDHEELSERIEMANSAAPDSNSLLGLFWGMGDHGGGATRADLKEIECQQSLIPNLIHSSTERLLEELKDCALSAPKHTGELQRVFTGCYTSDIKTKLTNRRSESLSQQAERFATLAWWFCNVPYPKEKMDRVWKDTLFNQFHDILPGSSTKRASECAQEIAGRQMKEAREVILASQIHLLKSKVARKPLTLVVFNPLPYPVKVPVDFEYMVGHRPILTHRTMTKITDRAGNPVKSQEEMPLAVTTEYDWRKRAVFEADLPALGYTEYQVEPAPKENEPVESAVKVIKDENSWTFVTPLSSTSINTKTGWIESFSSEGQENLLKSPGGRLLVMKDTGDSWGTDILRYDEAAGVFQLAEPENVPALTGQLEFEKMSPIRIIESGPVRTTVEIVYQYRGSNAAVRYTFYGSRHEVDVDVRIVWNEPRHQIKYSWPTVFQKETYRAEIPAGDISREQGGGELPHQRWLLLNPDDPKRNGFGLVAIGPGGHDIEDGEIRLSLLRSAIFCHYKGHPLRKERMHDFMDLGDTRFRMALVTAPSQEIREKLLRLTERLTLPPTPLIHYPLGGTPVSGLEAGASTLTIDGEGLELLAVKPSEDGSDLIVRICERNGKTATATLSVGGFIANHSMTFSPYEIITLRIDRAHNMTLCDLLERPLGEPIR